FLHSVCSFFAYSGRGASRRARELASQESGVRSQESGGRSFICGRYVEGEKSLHQCCRAEILPCKELIRLRRTLRKVANESVHYAPCLLVAKHRSRRRP